MDDEHPRNVVLLIRDIDEMKREQERTRQVLSDALANAEQASEAKGAFLSRMSHEIRTPLNAVMGYLELAQLPDADFEQVRHCVDSGETAAKCLLSIINDVLDVSAIEAGRMKIAHDEFDIIALLDDSEVVFDAQASRKKLNFSVERQGVTTRFVVGDAMRVNQILANLISNAVKFTPEGGSVVLRATEMSATDALVHFKFEVEDTGSGMTPEYMSRIFTPFEQENARVAAEHGGSGLGLSIVHNLVKMMDGAIDVKSSVGGGTKFTVTLAFERSHRARETDAVGAVPLDASYDVPPDSLNDYSGNRVLLAEDNPINVEIAQEMLGRFGLNIDRVDNGEDAISTFANSDADTYQMIFMDVQMPRMNGYDATKAIRASGHPQAKTIPIFAMTANAFAEDVSDALAAGMTGHISKPISLYKLQDVLARYLKCKDR